jgi:glycosyltransferase involved in cell wall biosynthesis
MRVLFVSDYTLTQRIGGAQVSNSLIIKKGRELGHEIVEHDYTSSIVDFLSSYDLLVSSNLERINDESRNKLDFIIHHPKHIRLEHDSCLYLDNSLRQELFESSKLNFFLSDFHVSFFREFYGDYFKNVQINYDPIDVELFSGEEKQKEYDIVYCGYLHPLKGVGNLIEYAIENKHRTIDVFGWSDPTTPPTLFDNIPNINYRGPKEYSEMPNIFKKAKAVYHHPIVNEPFCRMVGEALLCGVKQVIGAKEKIGSYLEFEKVGAEEFAKKCSTATENFWNKIEKL